MDNSSRKFLVSLHFEGLLISTKSSLHKTSMSKFWNTGVKSESHVKRVVKMQQSAPYLPGGRPESLIYDTIYESEEVADVSSELNPALVASIVNPLDKDCKLRINVYYSSSISTTPIIMASTSFSLRDFLRCRKALYKIIMGSEHCKAPIAYVRLLSKLGETLTTPAISSRAPDTNWNPLEQKYVFMDKESSAPIYCEELTAESRLAFKLPLLFLKNFASVLSETTVVWRKRARLERLRAGNFTCREEAYANGWYELCIAIEGCRITASRVETDSGNLRKASGVLLSTDLEEERARCSGSDEKEVFRPSSFVNVMLEDSRPFLTAIGRTNTEYNTLEPRYGHNRYPHPIKPKNRSSSAYRIDTSGEGSCVHLETLTTDFFCDDGRDSEYEVISSSRKDSGASQKSLAPQLHQDSAFVVYAPFIKGAKINFDLVFEDAYSGKNSMVGNCSLWLEDVIDSITSNDSPDVEHLFSKSPTQIPIEISKPAAHDRWVVSSATLSVAISINRKDRSASVLSPFIPHCKKPDFVNNSILSSKRNHNYDSRDKIEEKLRESYESSEQRSPRRLNESNSGVWNDNDDDVNPDVNSLESPTNSRGQTKRRLSQLISQNSKEYVSDGESSSDGENESEFNVDLLTALSPSRSTSDNDLLIDYGNSTTDAFQNMSHEDSAQLITDCYEFMWHLGFRGIDPLMMEKSSEGEETLSIEKLKEEDDLQADNILLEDVDGVVMGTAYTSFSKMDLTKTEGTGYSQGNQTMNNERVDVAYTQQFLKEYVAKLENMFSHLLMLISACEDEVSDDSSFRPSRLKKEIQFQPLPINFHYQVMTAQASTNADRVKDEETNLGFWINPPNSNPVVVWNSVTCGSFSAHACNYKKGGLTSILNQIAIEKDDLIPLKESYSKRIQFVSESDRLLNGLHAYNIRGSAASDRAALVSKIQKYENNVLNTTLRRLYTLSQVLSVAVNCFIMKFELVIENHIPSSVLEQWLQHGFLLVHECLLSVSGKERTMIEDSWMSIDTLKNYQIRLLPNPQDDHYRESNTWLAQNCSPGSKERKVPMSTWWRSVCSDELTDVYIVGREVQVFVPRKVVEQLPLSVKSVVEKDGAVFSFVPVLFSQGIDIMQSIATTMDSNYDIGDFQLHINLKAVQRLNLYCESVKPCASDSESTNLYSKKFSPHPLTAQLIELVRNTGISEKNVQMLIEVERICNIVGGCRVTFCKSGKDRTGMAITLEQSRLLGEACGLDNSDDRILRDANVMRQHGTRIMIAEKNIGRRIYAINLLQVKFLPLFYRPPLAVTENLIKSGDHS